MSGGKIISEMLLELYSFPASGDFHGHALSLLERFIPSEISTSAIIDLKNQRVEQKEVRSCAGLEVAETLEELSSLLPLHPFTRYFLTNRGGPVLCTDQVVSEAEWKQSVLYNELYCKYGVVHDATVRFCAGSQYVCFDFVTRMPLEEKYRRTLNLIAPHLGKAFSAFQIQQQGVQAKRPDNICLLTSVGTLLEYPAKAAALFSKYYPSEKRSAGLRLPEAVERWAFHEIRAARDGRNKVPERLTVRTAGQQLLLSLIQQTPGWLMVMEEYALNNTPAEKLMGLGLSRREAEVLAWIVQGKQNSDIATILSISTATVRKHAEHLMNKLHCETRGAAALIAMQTLATEGFCFSPDEACS